MMKQMCKISITNGLSYECLGDVELGLKAKQPVVLNCERYQDLGTIVELLGEPAESEEELLKLFPRNSRGRRIEGQKLPTICRLATAEDLAKVKENVTNANDIHVKTMERIKVHNLGMKLIHTHYALDQKLIVFQFSAEGRVDFRELLRDLSALFRVRIELLQIGVRDEAAVLGGTGTCGRPYCCASFLHGFNSINVKMAKQQGLSLNPQNISGACGRLKCCLQFEADVYKAAAQEKRLQKIAREQETPTQRATADNDQKNNLAGAEQETPKMESAISDNAADNDGNPTRERPGRERAPGRPARPAARQSGAWKNQQRPQEGQRQQRFSGQNVAKGAGQNQNRPRKPAEK